MSRFAAGPPAHLWAQLVVDAVAAEQCWASVAGWTAGALHPLLAAAAAAAAEKVAWCGEYVALVTAVVNNPRSLANKA
jgi:hypothetical protein